jgi:hypothetical protein
MRPTGRLAVRRRWWLTPLAVVPLVLVLLAVGLLAAFAVWTWTRLPADSEHTVWVSLYPGRNGNGKVTVALKRGRVADLGPFAERVAALVAPTANRSPAEVYENLDGSFKLVDVHLAESLLPRRLDTQAVQQALAAVGFRWLVVGLYVEERSQVVPDSVARAGKCWGYNGLSCEWRIATGAPPLKFDAIPSRSR